MQDRTNNNQKNLIICCVKCHKRLEGYGKYTDYAKKNKISVGTAWERLNKDKIKDKKRANAKRYYEAHKEEVLKKAHFRYKKQLGLTK